MKSERGCEQASFCQGCLRRERRILLQPSESRSSEDVVKSCARHSLHHVLGNDRSRFEAENTAESNFAKWRTIYPNPVVVGKPATFQFRTSADLRRDTQTFGECVF